MTKGENSLSPKSKVVSFLVRNQNTYEKLKTKSDNSLTEKLVRKKEALRMPPRRIWDMPLAIIRQIPASLPPNRSDHRLSQSSGAGMKLSVCMSPGRKSLALSSLSRLGGNGRENRQMAGNQIRRSSFPPRSSTS